MSIDPETGIEYPFFQNQLYDMFGEPDEDGPFAKPYLDIIDLSEFADALSHVLDFQGNPWSCRVYGNYVMKGPLRKAFGLIVSQGLAGQLKTYDGCFNIRPMKSGRQTSMHAWALALDFNQATNPFISADNVRRGMQLITDFSEEFIDCWLRAGWEWGGLWQSVKDAMHFQLAWTKDWRKVQGGPIPYEA